mmetsp:Transcript_9407/g.30686  ORF Transcript_9407/g.30686 Transcript_9407/m.30686 type:complete len:400 (+) Transcript_9407:1975-3174(+)
MTSSFSRPVRLTGRLTASLEPVPSRPYFCPPVPPRLSLAAGGAPPSPVAPSIPSSSLVIICVSLSVSPSPPVGSLRSASSLTTHLTLSTWISGVSQTCPPDHQPVYKYTYMICSRHQAPDGRRFLGGKEHAAHSAWDWTLAGGGNFLSFILSGTYFWILDWMGHSLTREHREGEMCRFVVVVVIEGNRVESRILEFEAEADVVVVDPVGEVDVEGGVGDVGRHGRGVVQVVSVDGEEAEVAAVGEDVGGDAESSVDLQVVGFVGAGSCDGEPSVFAEGGEAEAGVPVAVVRAVASHVVESFEVADGRRQGGGEANVRVEGVRGVVDRGALVAEGNEIVVFVEEVPAGLEGGGPREAAVDFSFAEVARFVVVEHHVDPQVRVEPLEGDLRVVLLGVRRRL